MRYFHCKRLNLCPEYTCVGLCDIVPERAEKMRDDFFKKDKPPLFADYRDMLKSARPEAVLVSTPHTLHFEHAYGALAAGANVMIDKPMVTNAAKARKLVKFAAAQRRVLQIAVQGTYTDTFAYAKQLIKGPTMGPLQLVTGVLAQGWMKGCAGTWRHDPKLSGGGQLYDSMAHVITAMLFLVDSPVREVFCWTDYKGLRIDINSVATVKFANGAMASLTCGGNCASWKSHLTFQGQNALLEIGPHGGDFKVQGGKIKEPIIGVPKRWKVPTVSPVRNFADSILGKAKPRCPATLGIMMADLMDALYASAASGKPAKVKKQAAL
jgi:predicted dehydrogenase